MMELIWTGRSQTLAAMQRWLLERTGIYEPKTAANLMASLGVGAQALLLLSRGLLV